MVWFRIINWSWFYFCGILFHLQLSGLVLVLFTIASCHLVQQSHCWSLLPRIAKNGREAHSQTAPRHYLCMTTYRTKNYGKIARVEAGDSFVIHHLSSTDFHFFRSLDNFSRQLQFQSDSEECLCQYTNKYFFVKKRFLFSHSKWQLHWHIWTNTFMLKKLSNYCKYRIA